MENKRIFLVSGFMLFYLGCMRVPKLEINNIETISKNQNLSNLVKLKFTENNWWEIYGDKNLNKLINISLETNKTLQIAFLNIEKSSEIINLSKSQNGPNIDLNGVLERQKISRYASPSRVLNPYRYTDVGQLELGGNYIFDLFGKFKALVKEANYQKDAMILNSKLVELTITTEVSQLYGEYLYLQLVEKNINERRYLLSEIIMMLEEKIKIGTGTIDELLVIQNDLSNLNISLKQNNYERNKIKNNLNLLTGFKATKNIEEILNDNENYSDISLLNKNLNINEVSSEVVEKRPDIQYYLCLIKGQQEHLKSLKADFYPQFSINGRYGFDSVKLGDLFEKSSLSGLIGSGITFPIFHGGAIKSNYKIGGVDLNIFIENYNETLLNAFNNVNNSIIKAKTANEILNLSNQNLNKSTKIYLREKERYYLGSSSKYDYLVAKYNLLTITLTKEESLYNRYLQQINLINALGGYYVGGDYGKK